MKIAFIASELAMPGQGMQLAHLALAAKNAGHEVLVLSLGGVGEPGAWLLEKGIKVKALNALSWRLVPGLARLAGCIMAFRPSLTQTWGFRANLAGKTIGFLSGARLVVSSMRSPCQPKVMELERITSFLCAKNVASSSWLANFAKSCGHSKGQFVVIGNACDINAFKFKERRRPIGKDGKWKLLFVGDRSMDSGIPDLISAASGLAKSGMPFKLTLVGSGDRAFDAEMLYHIQSMNLSSKIEIKGRIPHSSMPALLEESHLLIAPNAFCWSPNALLEAFASGLPVVASNVEGVKELVTDGKTGRLFASLDPSSLARKIVEATMDYNVSLRMAREACKVVHERNNPKTICGDYLALYESLFPR